MGRVAWTFILAMLTALLLASVTYQYVFQAATRGVPPEDPQANQRYYREAMGELHPTTNRAAPAAD